MSLISGLDRLDPVIEIDLRCVSAVEHRFELLVSNISHAVVGQHAAHVLPV